MMAYSDVSGDFRPSMHGLPPQSLECEEALLGAILFDPSAIDRCFDILKPEMFYFSAHQKIYQAMLELKMSDRPTDLMQVSMWLEDRQQIEAVGGRATLARMVDVTVGTYSVDLHAQVVREKWQRRRLIEIADRLQSAARDSSKQWDSIIEEAQQAIFDLTPSSQQGGLRPLSEILPEAVAEIENRQAGLVESGVQTGFYDVDQKIRGGLKPGKLVIIAGRPAMGKSAFAAAIAQYVAGQGKTVAFFSLEMEDSEVAQRFLSVEASVPGDRLGAGEVTPDEWGDLAFGISKLSEVPIYIDQSESVSPAHVLTQCRNLKAKSKGNLGLVVIDYLHLMLDGGDDEVRELGKITRDCKKMSRKLGTPVILLSQLSRGVESRTNKRPMMSDLRQSGAIEQDADLILMLYRDEYYNEDTTDRGIAEIIIAKNRGGATGTAKLLFEPQYTRFRNLAKGDR